MLEEPVMTQMVTNCHGPNVRRSGPRGRVSSLNTRTAESLPLSSFLEETTSKRRKIFAMLEMLDEMVSKDWQRMLIFELWESEASLSIYPQSMR
jgi:hypothetical protein